MCWICNGCHVLSPLAGVTFSEGRLPREIRQDTNHSNDIGCLISFTWPRWQHHHGFRTPGFKGVKFEAKKNAYLPIVLHMPTTTIERPKNHRSFKKKQLGSLYFETFDLPAIRDWDSLWPKIIKATEKFQYLPLSNQLETNQQPALHPPQMPNEETSETEYLAATSLASQKALAKLGLEADR